MMVPQRLLADNCAAEPQDVAYWHLADKSATSALVRYWSNSEHCSTPALIALVANNYCNADVGEYDPALGAKMTADRRLPNDTVPKTLSANRKKRELSETAARDTSRHFAALQNLFSRGLFSKQNQV